MTPPREAPQESAFAKLQRLELARARKKFGNQHGPHESYAVILEEVDEFWEGVKRKNHDTGELVSELIQIAAMAQRAAEDNYASWVEKAAAISDG